jgi:hypothetical protein
VAETGLVTPRVDAKKLTSAAMVDMLAMLSDVSWPGGVEGRGRRKCRAVVGVRGIGSMRGGGDLCSVCDGIGGVGIVLSVVRLGVGRVGRVDGVGVGIMTVSSAVSKCTVRCGGPASYAYFLSAAILASSLLRFSSDTRVVF